MSLSATSRARAGVVSTRSTSRVSRVRVVAAAQRPSAPNALLQNAAGIAAAIALITGAPSGPALAAERTPNNTPLAWEDLPKDGPKSAPPGEKQPGDGIDVPRSNAKARQDANDLSVGKTPAGQPRRISALPAAPSLYEVANLGDTVNTVKGAVGLGRELNNVANAGNEVTSRLTDETKNTFGEQAKDALRSGRVEQALNSAKGAADDVVAKAKTEVSALPSVPSLYEVADLKEVLGFNREVGDTDSAGTGAGGRLQESAKEAFSGGAEQAKDALQANSGTAGRAVNEAKDKAGNLVEQAKSKISALPSVPSLYEVADLKEVLGFNREVGDTESAGTGAGARLQESAKEAFAGGVDQAQDKAQNLAGDAKSQAKDVAKQAKDAIQSQLQ